MDGAHQNVNGLPDLTVPLSGMVCHLWSSTHYDQPVCQMWNLSTQCDDRNGATKYQKWVVWDS